MDSKKAMGIIYTDRGGFFFHDVGRKKICFVVNVERKEKRKEKKDYKTCLKEFKNVFC